MTKSQTRVLRGIVLITGVFAALVMVVGARLAMGGPARAQRKSVHYEARTARSWEQVLASPRPISVQSLITGRVIVPKTMLLDGENPAMRRFVDDGSPMLVFAHLVRHAQRGELLVDSGLDATYAHGKAGHLRAPGSWFYALQGVRFEQAPGEDLHAQTARLSAHPRALFFTHLHGDHASALPSFALDFPVFVGAAEADDLSHHLDFGLVDSRRTLHEIQTQEAPALWPFEHAVDVFGDGSFWAISTPGHTRGHLSYLVNGREGAVLLTGDACHMRWAFDHDVAPSGADDAGTRAARDSLERIRTFAEHYPQVRIVFGHQFR